MLYITIHMSYQHQVMIKCTKSCIHTLMEIHNFVFGCYTTFNLIVWLFINVLNRMPKLKYQLALQITQCAGLNATFGWSTNHKKAFTLHVCNRNSWRSEGEKLYATYISTVIFFELTWCGPSSKANTLVSVSTAPFEEQ